MSGGNRRRRIARATAIVSGAVLLCISASTVFASVLASFDPLEQNIEERIQSPGGDHPFGTDGFGRDVLSRILHGGRISLAIGLLSVMIAALIGVPVGAFSAQLGGLFDLLVQRFVDLFLGIPFLVLSLVVVVALTPSTIAVAAAMSIALTPQVIRLARGRILAISSEPYIVAARVNGASEFDVMIKHLLPNAMPSIVAQLAGYFGTAITAEAALSFLGLGVPPPGASWGRMLREGSSQYLESAPWLTILPGIALTVTVLCVALLGDALRDLSDRRG